MRLAFIELSLAWVVFREHVDSRLFIGVLAIVAGALLLSWQGDFGKAGCDIFLIVFACLTWGIDNNLTRKISASDPVVLAAIKGVAAGSVNTTLALSIGAVLPSLPTAFGAMSLGFVSYGIRLVLFIVTLRHLGTARTGAITERRLPLVHWGRHNSWRTADWHDPDCKTADGFGSVAASI